MQLEFHQLERRMEHLRVRRPERHRRLLASLAASGQQTPIVVVAAEQPDQYLLIDGYQRVAALEQLGRDTVDAGRRHRGACGDEVPGSGGPVAPGRLPAHGGGVCTLPVKQPWCGTVRCRLANCDSCGSTQLQALPVADAGCVVPIRK